MPQCIAALFALARALGTSFAPPRGRHAARRRRSRRVRPYAPLPATPAPPLPARPKPRDPAPGLRQNPPTRPAGLAPPSTEPRAEDIAPVRPYLTAHEERDLAQRRATDLLRAWGAEPPPTDRARPAVRDWGTDFPVPTPRVPAPRVPSRMAELPHLSRLRHRQQQRQQQHRAQVAAL